MPKLPQPSPLPGPSVGSPLAPQMASPISASFGVDVSSVRVHSDAASIAASSALGARAFTLGGHVFLGGGERPTDMPLIAHEVAHTVQQQGAPRVQLWGTGNNDRHEHEAHRASAAVVRQEPFAVVGRTVPQIQGLGIKDALDYFADKANVIPGFRMFTLVIGVNPINMSRVERTGANFLRALIELVPGGGIVTQVLDRYGVIDHAAAWITEQVQSLGITAASIVAALKQFVDGLSLSDIFDLGAVWDRAKRIFTAPIDRLIDFGASVIKGVLRFVREAVLAPLASLAQATKGWDLLKAVLGQDPITGEPYPRSAETLIGGFMKLIGQEEVWENIKKGNAKAKAWAWFQSALSGLMALVRSIPGRFVSALKDLEFTDFLVLPSALGKLAKVFGAFVVDFTSWALDQVLSLLQIIFEVVAPGAMPYIRKAAGALKDIIRAPMRFVGNLVKAAKLGFQNFGANFLEHLKEGLIDWLTGALPSVYIPKGFSPQEILKFVLSVLGLTWENIRGKLVAAVGDTAVKALETGFDVVVKLVREGPAAAWEAIKEQLSNLKDMVIGGITDFVVDTVVQKAIPQLAALFIPGAGFITAIIKIYDTIMVFVSKISKIIQVVTGFIDSISAIGAGAYGAAAARVEGILTNLLGLAINFLAGFAGLGKVSGKILAVIEKIRAPIDKALDWLIGWIVNAARRLGRFVAQAGVPKDPNERVRLAANAAVAAARRLSGRITLPLLQGVLGAIKVRYGLTQLTPYEQAGTWWVKVTVNPEEKKPLGVPTAAAGAAGTGFDWLVRKDQTIRADGKKAVVKDLEEKAGARVVVYSFAPPNTGFVRTTWASFKAKWDNGKIVPDAERDKLVARHGAAAGNAVADSMQRRRELGRNIGVPDTQAHHLVPVELLGGNPLLVRLVHETKWNPHDAGMGLPLPEGFHGNHPAYNRFVNSRIMAWAKTQPASAPGMVDLVVFETWLKATLVPQLKTEIGNAQSSGKSLNDYFKTKS